MLLPRSDQLRRAHHNPPQKVKKYPCVILNLCSWESRCYSRTSSVVVVQTTRERPHQLQPDSSRRKTSPAWPQFHELSPRKQTRSSDRTGPSLSTCALKRHIALSTSRAPFPYLKHRWRRVFQCCRVTRRSSPTALDRLKKPAPGWRYSSSRMDSQT